jgi:hypothetical protein
MVPTLSTSAPLASPEVEIREIQNSKLQNSPYLTSMA